MNLDRVDNLLYIAERLDKETKNKSITLDTGEMIDLLISYKDLYNTKHNTIPYYNDPKKFKGEELYCLWETCFIFLLPRLKKFRDWVGDYPHSLGSNEKWKEVLDEMIWFVDITIETHKYIPTEQEERYNKAKKLFNEYFFDLWG